MMFCRLLVFSGLWRYMYQCVGVRQTAGGICGVTEGTENWKWFILIMFWLNYPTHTHTHPFNSAFSGTTRVGRCQKVKPISILLKQETMSGSGISWDICESATCSRQVTMPASHHSVFYRPDALPSAQPTASKHWRQVNSILKKHLWKYHVVKIVASVCSKVSRKRYEIDISLCRRITFPLLTHLHTSSHSRLNRDHYNFAQSSTEHMLGSG